jgi:hypothetical protein
MNYNKKELAKNLIKKIGIDIILQCLIELIDDSIDSTDYDIDSIRNSQDVWKFKILEGLEQSYEAYLKNNIQPIGEQ